MKLRCSWCPVRFTRHPDRPAHVPEQRCGRPACTAKQLEYEKTITPARKRDTKERR